MTNVWQNLNFATANLPEAFWEDGWQIMDRWTYGQIVGENHVFVFWRYLQKYHEGPIEIVAYRGGPMRPKNL